MILTWQRYFHLAHLTSRYEEVQERAFTRSHERVCVHRKDPCADTVQTENRRRTNYDREREREQESLRQPDLLPSPVIIIIKSTLRAVRALVKECFISPTHRSAPEHPTPLPFDNPRATTSPTGNHLGRRSRRPFCPSKGWRPSSFSLVPFDHI